MASLRKAKGKQGQGVYRARVRIKGRPIQSATFSSLKDAKQWIAKTEAEIYTQRYFPERSHTEHTLSETIERYLCEVLPYKSPNTIIGQTQRLHWWITKLGDYKLSDITPDVVSRYRDYLALKRSAGTVNCYLSNLSYVFGVAIKNWQWVDQSPMIKVRRCVEPRGRTRFLADDERRRLLAECRASKCPVLYTVVVLALSTGARRMEILGLRWGDIDLLREVMHVRETKNGTPRMLPLTGLALNLLKHLHNIRQGASRH